MERLGKINKVDIYYLHWDDPKRDYYLEWLPDKIYVLFVIGDDANRMEDYKKMTEFFISKNVFEVYLVGKDETTIYRIYKDRIFKKEEDEGRGYPHPKFLEGATWTSTNDNFDWGFWMTTEIYEFDPIDEIICIDFTERKVRKYLKHITKLIRKGWLPRSNYKEFSVGIKPKEPIYDDEIKKPLKRSQRGFEKY